MTPIDLTDEQLVYLGARDDLTDAQRAKITAARARLDAVARLGDLSPAAAGFVADVVSEASTTLMLVHQHCRSRYACRVCARRPEPIRYRSGRRRGEVKDFGTISAVELADRFVRISGHVTLGCCSECFTRLLPRLREELRGVQAQVPPTLRAESATCWKRRSLARCTACEWNGHEGELGPVQTLAGNGYYRGRCPSCGAENRPFGRTVIETSPSFVVVESEPGVCEVCDRLLTAWSYERKTHLDTSRRRCRDHAEPTS